jgi:hypothetical protein
VEHYCSRLLQAGQAVVIVDQVRLDWCSSVLNLLSHTSSLASSYAPVLGQMCAGVIRCISQIDAVDSLARLRAHSRVQISLSVGLCYGGATAGSLTAPLSQWAAVQ